MTMFDAWILDAVRTPRGRGKAGKGALSNVHPQELFAQTLKAVVARTGTDPRRLDDVIAGCVSQVGEQGANLSRNAVLTAGLPQELSGVTLNRFCGSGLQSVLFGAMGVASGMQGAVIAGGVESMSRVNMGADGGGTDGGNLTLRKQIFQVPQGISADLIATIENFSRAELDAWGARSHQRAAAAQNAGYFDGSLVPVVDPTTGQIVLSRDETVRPETTAESLAALPAAFTSWGAAPLDDDGATMDQVALRAYPNVAAIEHRHSAGNSSGIVDGAAAVLLANKAWADANGIRPRARIRAVATVGSEPVIMLTAPAPASRKALAQAGMVPSDIDLWEINEAFAAVVLQTVRALEIDPQRVNVNGGAIALGHPLGATGAILIGMAVDELERRGLATACVTLCIGGGQGIAAIIERV
jgi:acetyl-CoA C-acetyltransferase